MCSLHSSLRFSISNCIEAILKKIISIVNNEIEIIAHKNCIIYKRLNMLSKLPIQRQHSFLQS